MLSGHEKIIIVGPNQNEVIDVKSRSDGVYCMTEDDGLRVTTSENTYFFELVQDATIQTFGLA